jgi:hypothetical protein
MKLKIKKIIINLSLSLVFGVFLSQSISAQSDNYENLTEEQRICEFGKKGPSGGIMTFFEDSICYEVKKLEKLNPSIVKIENIKNYQACNGNGCESLNLTSLSGEQNTNELIKKNLSPASKACRSLGENWFLPSKTELLNTASGKYPTMGNGILTRDRRILGDNPYTQNPYLSSNISGGFVKTHSMDRMFSEKLPVLCMTNFSIKDIDNIGKRINYCYNFTPSLNKNLAQVDGSRTQGFTFANNIESTFSDRDDKNIISNVNQFKFGEVEADYDYSNVGNGKSEGIKEIVPAKIEKIKCDYMGDWQFIGGESNTPSYVWVDSEEGFDKEKHKYKSFLRSRVYSYKYVCQKDGELIIEFPDFIDYEIDEGDVSSDGFKICSKTDEDEDFVINWKRNVKCQMFYFYPGYQELAFNNKNASKGALSDDPNWHTALYPGKHIYAPVLIGTRKLPEKKETFSHKIELNTSQIEKCDNIKIKFINPSAQSKYLNENDFNKLTNLVEVNSVYNLTEVRYQWRTTNDIPDSLDDINKEKMHVVELSDNKTQAVFNVINQKPTKSGIYYLHVFVQDDSGYQKYQTSAYYLDFEPPVCGICACDNEGKCNLNDSTDDQEIAENNPNVCEIEKSQEDCSIEIKDKVGNITNCICTKKIEESSEEDLDNKEATNYGECDSRINWCLATGPREGYSSKCCEGNTLLECVPSESGNSYYKKIIDSNATQCGGSGNIN